MWGAQGLENLDVNREAPQMPLLVAFELFLF